MGQPFERGSFIVLVLLFIFGVIFAWDTVSDITAEDDIVSETAARSTYLLERVKKLEFQVRDLEIKAGIRHVNGKPAATAKPAAAQAAKPATAPAAKKAGTK